MGKPTLFLAAGHGADDPGNTSGKYVERDETIRFSNAVWSPLMGMGVYNGVGGAVLIPHNVKLQGEIDMITAYKPDENDLGVNIHFDWKGSAGGSGSMMIVDDNPLAKQWAREVLERWCRLTGIRKGEIADSKQWAREVRKWGPSSDMGFCRARWPGVIFEVASLNCEDDMRIAQNPAFQHAAAVIMWETWLRYRSPVQSNPKT